MHLAPITPTSHAPANVSPAGAPTDIVQNEQELCARLATAKAGDVITYHVGMLARDRAPLSQVLSAEGCRTLGAVADRVLALAEADWVHLLQRRLGEGCFAYFLVVKRRPRHARGGIVSAPPRCVLAEAA